MPSLDIVSKVDMQEVSNAVDQAKREVDNRFDFKGSGAVFEQNDSVVTMKAQSSFHLQQMLTILQTKLAKRGVDIRSMSIAQPQESLNEARQLVTIKQGIEQDEAKKIVKTIKETKIKVQASIQGDQVRVSGKKRDDLQQIITILKDSKIDLPLQFENFRD